MGRSEILLSVIVFILIGLLTFLTVYQSPSMDDFVGRYYFEVYGYWDGVRSYLTHGNSRYFSLPVFLAASASTFLVDHYYIVLMTGIFLFLGCVYYFLKSLLNTITQEKTGSGKLILLSGVLFLSFCSLVKELPSFIYWFATTITYLLPFGLFLILFSVILQVKNQLTITSVLLLISLKLMIGGSNELILFYSMYLTLLLVLNNLIIRKSLTKLSLLLIVMDLIVLIIFFSIPGASSRSHDFSVKQSIIFSFTGAGFRVFQLLIFVLSNPVFWIGLLVTLYGSFIADPYIKEWIYLKKRSGIVIDLLLILFPAIFFIFAIRHFGGEVVPPRAENILLCIMVLMIYAAVFCWSVKLVIPYVAQGQGYKRIITFLPRISVYIFALIFLFSPLSYGILQNLVMLPVHKSVVQERVNLIRQEKLKGKKLVIIPSYLPQMNQQLEKQYGKKAAEFFKTEFSIPPSFSYFKDDPNNPSNNYAYAEYYKIDSMRVDTAIVLKWSLTDKLLFGDQ